jgi:hypothetical protein
MTVEGDAPFSGAIWNNLDWLSEQAPCRLPTFKGDYAK